MGYWMKLYVDILDDEKVMCEISDTGQLGMFFVFLVAKKLDNPNVGSLQSIAFHSRKPIQFWQEAMPELLKSGIVIEENGSYFVKNFEKRQSAIDSTERSRQSRKNKNDESQKQRFCNDSATIRHGEREKEAEIEAETEEDEAQPNFFSKFQSVIGLLLAGDKDTQYLKTLIHDYGEEKILKTAEWLRKKDPDLKSMRVALKSIDTAAANWGETKKQMGEFGKEFTADQILGAQ